MLLLLILVSSSSSTGRVGGVGGPEVVYAATASRASIRAGKRRGAHDDVAAAA